MTPRTFTDSQNRVWTVSIVYQTICDVLAHTGLDLLGLVADHDVVAMELDNPLTLKKVLAIVLKSQLEAAGITIDILYATIVNEDQQTEMVTALYRAVFDFSPSQGAALNDALGKMDRALKTAKATSAANLKHHLDSGKMDAFLGIMTDPATLGAWIQAAQDPSNTALHALWGRVTESNLPAAKQTSTFVAQCVEQGLTLPVAATVDSTGSDQPEASATQATVTQPAMSPAAAAAMARATAVLNGSMSSPSSGSSPGSAESVPGASAGGSST